MTTKDFPIKIIRLPTFFKKRQFSSKLNCSLIPPLALGLISGYLRSKGMPIEQDDLNIKIQYDNTYSEYPDDIIDTEIFFDSQRIIKYNNGQDDSYLDSIMEKIMSKVTICADQIMLLSLPDNIENNSNLMFAMAFSRFIKEKYNTINILGGENLWLDLLRSKYRCNHIDYIIYGEGEFPVYHLLNYIIYKRPLDNIKGLSFLDEGKVIYSNITSRPIKPDFSGLPVEKYRVRKEVLGCPDGIKKIIDKFESSNAIILPYKFIKGCPFECIFCSSSNRELVHVLSPEETASHLKSLQEEYCPTGFFFLSDTINISKRYINEFCDEIINAKTKIRWSDCARADNLDRETLFKMRKAGCIRLIFGMETASQKLLRYVNKKIDLKQLENALKWSDEAGIWSGVEVICGLPHENEEDIESTIAFLNTNKKYINRIYLNYFDLREGTPLYKTPDQYGLKRIFEVDRYAKKDFSSYVRFGFDEIDGLEWPDKEKEIEYSLKKVQESCTQGFRYFTDEHLLFFLYSNFDDKKEIKSIYLKILKQG